MQYIIELIYGDTTGDGHGMHDSDFYRSNYKTKDIAKAVASSEIEYNLFFDKDICAEYGECTINSDIYDRFFAMGIDIASYIEDWGDDGYFVHSFTGLYLAFAKLSLPDLQTEYMTITDDSIDIGGYGLFEN